MRGKGKYKDINSVPEKEKAYPEPTIFGGMPSYGFSIRYVEGLTMDNINITTDNKDPRTAIILKSVKNVRMSNIRLNKNDLIEDEFKIQECKNKEF